MTVLTQGGNTALGATSVKVALDWPTSAGSLDASAYLLTADGKVRGDEDMIFFNQPRDNDGAVAVLASGAGSIAFQIELAKMPAAIERVVFCLTVETPAKTMAAFNGVSLAASGPAGPIASFDPDIRAASEAAMMVAELYLRNGAWKLRAIAQGFNGGLAPLARSFGIDVAENTAPLPTPLAPPPVQAAPPPPPVQAPQPAAPAAAPAPAPRVSLSKITLDKAKPSVSLEKRGATFGEITINLNWSSTGKSLFGKPKAIDLDLGCLFELDDGTKGAVQALGRSFGEFDREPYIALSGDDRTGAVTGGETLRVNGRYWSRLRRIALYAFIYEGAPNWRSTDGLVTITMPDQPPIEIAMNEGQDGMGFCGLALIENIGGTMKFTRVVEYFKGHKFYDERMGWGMRWQAGSK